MNIYTTTNYDRRSWLKPKVIYKKRIGLLKAFKYIDICLSDWQKNESVQERIRITFWFEDDFSITLN